MTQPSEAERVRSYILTQANKLTLPDLVAKVRADTAPLRAAAEAVPAARLFDRPSPTDWSAAEVLTHILDMNDHGAASITGILDGGGVPATVRDLMTGGTRTHLSNAAGYWAAYEARRESLLSRVLEARGDEHLHVTITHQTFGSFSWREWLLFMRVHDLDHMRQLDALAAYFAGQ
ncbi:MAG TPA: DinB family protein [Tepidiformaceae bacterium]|nr:DinB family protein [Tepidiformaceae bacterium]